MSKQKLAIIVLCLFFFVDGMDIASADGKPSWCSQGKENAMQWSNKTAADWDNCCANYNEAKCNGESDNQVDYQAAPDDNQADYQPAPDVDNIEENMIENDETYGQSLVNPNSSSSGSGSSYSSGSSSGGSLGDLSGLAGTTGLPNPSGGIKGVVDRVLNWMLGIFGALALLAFVISGIMYLTAAGESTKMENAKKAMIWSIIGVAVGLGGVVILQTIDYLLR